MHWLYAYYLRRRSRRGNVQMTREARRAYAKEVASAGTAEAGSDLPAPG